MQIFDIHVNSLLKFHLISNAFQISNFVFSREDNSRKTNAISKCYVIHVTPCYDIYFVQKTAQSIFKNLHNSGMVGHRKLPNPPLNRIFNALLIGVQSTLSFQLTNFGLRCLRGKLREGLKIVAMTTIWSRTQLHLTKFIDKNLIKPSRSD